MGAPRSGEEPEAEPAGTGGRGAEVPPMTADTGNRLLQDRVLAEAARRGERVAFDELYRRHAASCWRLAVVATGEPGAASRAMSDAFAGTLSNAGPTPEGPRGVLLSLLLGTRLSAVAAAALVPTAVARPGSPTSAASPDDGVAAFAALPERGRSGLWLMDLEGFSAREAAVVLEVAPRSAGLLVERARLGLREQMLHTHVAKGDTRCRRMAERLPDYAEGALAERDALSTRRHLDVCPRCRARLEALDDLKIRLRRSVPGLPPQVHEDAAARWASALVPFRGPLHLRRPGGRPVPAWLERAVAGAAAAAIALGITGAILAGGRSRAHDGRALPADREASLVGGDGESALGAGDGLAPLVLDGYGFVPPAFSSPSAPDGIDPVTRGAAGPPALPSTGAGAAGPVASPAPLPAPDPAPEPAPSPTTTTTAPTNPDEPPPAPPAAEVTVGVGDTLAVTVGDACTGLTLLGTTVGCAPTTTDDPVTLDTGGTLLSPLGL